MMRYLLFCIVLCTATSCGNVPPVPNDYFYRLALPAAGIEKIRISDDVVHIGHFRAEGIYNERALIYTHDPSGRELQLRHYNFWITPPPRLLRDHLIEYLRASDSAPMVLAESHRKDGHRINGRVLAFEAQTHDTQSIVNVVLELSYEIPGGDQPLLIKQYSAREPVTGKEIADTVTAFNTGVEKIFNHFLTDIRQLTPAN